MFKSKQRLNRAKPIHDCPLPALFSALNWFKLLNRAKQPKPQSSAAPAFYWTTAQVRIPRRRSQTAIPKIAGSSQANTRSFARGRGHFSHGPIAAALRAEPQRGQQTWQNTPKPRERIQPGYAVRAGLDLVSTKTKQNEAKQAVFSDEQTTLNGRKPGGPIPSLCSYS